MRLRYAYFDQNGTPMELEVSGKTASSFEFALDPKAVLRLETSAPSIGQELRLIYHYRSGDTGNTRLKSTEESTREETTFWDTP